MFSTFSDIHEVPHSSPRQSNNFPPHGVGHTETLLPISNLYDIPSFQTVPTDKRF
ncbi:hypothetical protein BDN71DRAFT_1457470, partial [Pleurotus eryngii]